MSWPREIAIHFYIYNRFIYFILWYKNIRWCISSKHSGNTQRYLKNLPSCDCSSVHKEWYSPNFSLFLLVSCTQHLFFLLFHNNNRITQFWVKLVYCNKNIKINMKSCMICSLQRNTHTVSLTKILLPMWCPHISDRRDRLLDRCPPWQIAFCVPEL